MLFYFSTERCPQRMILFHFINQRDLKKNDILPIDLINATNHCGAFTWTTRLETPNVGWRLSFQENSSSFARYKEQGKGLKCCANPPTASVPVEVGSTPSSTSMVSVSVWGERGRKELLLQGAGVKAGVTIAVSNGQGRCSLSNHHHHHHHHHIGSNKPLSLRG